MPEHESSVCFPEMQGTGAGGEYVGSELQGIEAFVGNKELKMWNSWGFKIQDLLSIETY